MPEYKYNEATGEFEEVGGDAEEMRPEDFIQTVTPAMLETMANQTKTAYPKNSKFFKWEDSKPSYRLRVLPGRIDWGTIFFVSHNHWVTKGERRLPLPCIAHLGYGCPVCSYASSLASISPKLAEDSATQTKFIYNVVDIDAPELTVQVYEAPKTVHEVLMVNYKDGWDLTGMKTGKPVRISRKKENGKTSYTVNTLPEPFALPQKLLIKAHNLKLLAEPPITKDDLLTQVNEVRALMPSNVPALPGRNYRKPGA